MDTKEFQSLRSQLEKTQKQMSQLLGTSLRAVQSFEQGWRKVPVHVERQMLFLAAMKKGMDKLRPCWEIQGCDLQRRQACPAWEFQVGQFCWFISGTICRGKPLDSWNKKMKICRKCQVLESNMKF